MKIHEIFTEYIELKSYTNSFTDVVHYTTLYNGYIKPTFGNKEVSTLMLQDYQKFTNTLLFSKFDDSEFSFHSLQKIINVLVDIYRFAIKAGYYHGDNLPLLINLK